MNLSRKDTLAALLPLKSAIAARTAIQELSHIWFDGSHVYATNGGLGIKVAFKSPLKCGVPGGLFLGLLDQAAADTVEFEFADNVINLKAGRSKVTMNTLPLEQRVWRYPDKITGRPLASIKVTDALIKGLKSVMALRPSSPKRMEHFAVCIFVEGDEMDLYVTDSVSMLLAPVSEKVTGSLDKLAIPRELAEQIVAQCAPGEDLKLFADYFTTRASADVTLFSNVFDTGEMLDLPSFVNRLADDKTAPPFPVPEGLKAALERAVLMAGGEDPFVALTVNAKALAFSGRYKFGNVEESFVLPKAIAKATITLDGKSLLRALNGAKKLAIAGSAVNLRDDDGFMYILGSKEPPRPAARAAAVDPEED